ncbi:1728_t:CDS:2 [Entrophospora sp. SA101]|nr:1728_t:CDS:2 [Entrophospora sp. SA101]
MTNAQEDLNQKYPPNKAQVETIYLEDLNFNQLSELIIDNYPNLEKITNNYQEISNLTQLTITNLLKNLVVQQPPIEKTLKAEQSQQMVSQLKEELQLEQEAAQSYDETQLELEKQVSQLQSQLTSLQVQEQTAQIFQSTSFLGSTDDETNTWNG